MKTDFQDLKLCIARQVLSCIQVRLAKATGWRWLEAVGWLLLALVVPTVLLVSGKAGHVPTANFFAAIGAYALGWGAHAIGARHGRPLGYYEVIALLLVALYGGVGIANLLSGANPDLSAAMIGVACAYFAAARLAPFNPTVGGSRSGGPSDSPTSNGH